MRVILNLSAEVSSQLEEKAARSGKTLSAYLEQLAENEARGVNRSLAPDLSPEDFERLLDDLASGPALPHLPDNFSRADIYADHD